MYLIPLGTSGRWVLTSAPACVYFKGSMNPNGQEKSGAVPVVMVKA